ncbi:MAG: Crp/Fnr family transcriptional regulator [Bacteroidia bacterium]|nr:Crp/Fnr family transcriptional regulator [Bacteroidia bacterium]
MNKKSTDMPDAEVSNIERIREVFAHFEPNLIESLIDHSMVKTYGANEAIIRTGQFMPSTVLVLEGRVKVYRESDDGSEFFLYYLTPGQACAVSMSCAARMESSQITAIATESTKLIMFPVQTMNEWIKEYRSWYEFVISTYRNRFEEVLTVLDHVAFRGMDERLEFYLKNQWKTCGCSDIPINHQTIAQDLNSSREVISRLLKKMEQRNMLVLHRNHIEIKGNWISRV